MQDKPRFMSPRWQQKLLQERPALFWLLIVMITFPVLFVLRLGMKGELGVGVQTGLRIFAALLALGLIWLVLAERMRRKERNRLIDNYMELRHQQTHDQDPPSS